MRTPIVTALAAAALAVTLAACSTSVEISADSLAEQLADALEEEVGQRPDEVECSGALKGEVGATQDCTLTAGPDELGVTVTVTEVDGSDVNFDYVVEEMPS